MSFTRMRCDVCSYEAKLNRQVKLTRELTCPYCGTFGSMVEL